MKIPALLFTGCILLIVLASAACTPSTTPQQAPEMPVQRPADFRITVSEEAGSDHLWARYRVSDAYGAYEQKKATKEVTVWEFTPTPEAVDSLYAIVRASGVTQLVSQTEGEPSARFGYVLEMTYEGHEFKLADQGNQYIRLEADYNKFKDLVADIRAFVGKGIDHLKFEATAEVILDPSAPRPDSLSVKLEQASLIALQPENKPGDTLQGSFTALRDRYKIVATAQSGTKEWVWAREIALDTPMTVQLRLGKEGFKEEGI